MAMMREPVRNLSEFVHMAESGVTDSYPFNCVVLYAPMNGLHARLRKYVRSHWDLLDGMTGAALLVFTVDEARHGPSEEPYKPGDIYEIARHLGASADDLPGIVFFLEPTSRKETLVLRFGDFLPDPGALTDDDLTDLFQSIVAIVDSCVQKKASARLTCLRRGLDKEWPEQSRWASEASTAGTWLVTSTATGATVLQSVASIMTILRGFGLGG